MNTPALIDISHHRSRDRIRDMGEVFTPEQYVKQMLSLFDAKIWADEDVIFFEPSAGNGNIVLPILEKRVEALAKKFKQKKESNSELRALAIALNTLWAIDICPNNIHGLRGRIFAFAIHYLLKHEISLRTRKNKDYLVHVLCTLLWQIQENETLSALADEENVVAQVIQTKLGHQWFQKNKHRPLSFHDDWCSHFTQNHKSKAVSTICKRAQQFLDQALIDGTARGFNEFDFSKTALETAIRDECIRGVA